MIIDPFGCYPLRLFWQGANTVNQDLKSNPEGPLDSHLEDLSKKKYKNVAGELHEL